MYKIEVYVQKQYFCMYEQNIVSLDAYFTYFCG